MWLGQHFLTDKGALKKIASLLDLSAKGGSASGGKKENVIIEIGPGHGELTEQILNNELRIKNNGIKIIAVEKDKQLAEALQKKFAGDRNIKIINGDVLKIFPSLIAELPNCPIADYKLIGNIPYYITGKLLRTLSELENKPSITVLTIQKEVAERLAAKPPHMNRLAASVQFWAEPKIEMTIPREKFRPAPEVDSATIVLNPTHSKTMCGIKSEIYYKTVRVIFAQPRKTILNNIASRMGIAKNDAAKMFKEIGIAPNLRPQDLSVEDIVRITAAFQ